MHIGPHRLGPDLLLIAGPCVLEEPDRVFRIAEGVAAVADALGIPTVFKASFDKANRTALSGRRGPGLDAGLRLLEQVRERTGLPLTTDVHQPDQAAAVAEVVDLLQVPAFLCRQTDLLLACAATGTPVNVKKGQFLAPSATGPLVEKLQGSAGVLLTERGSSFGHGDLVVDFRGLVEMRRHAPVVFDCTHSCQQPSALGDRSGGQRALARPLARAAAAVGIDGLFVEVHDDPDHAWSDAATQQPLSELRGLVEEVLAVRAALAASEQEGLPL